MSDQLLMTTPGHPSPAPPLGRGFWTVWTGQTVSTVGSALSGVGVAVYVYAETRSVAWLGVLLALAALPAVAVMPLLGLVDRMERRRVMIVADLLAAVGPAVALALALSGRLEVWHLAVAGFLAGVGTAVQSAAYQAAVPALVPVEALARANGLVQFAPALAITGGPVAATALLAGGGLEAVLAVDLLCCLLGVTATAITPFRSLPAGDRDTAPAADGIAAGWSWLWQHGRSLLLLCGVAAATNLVLAFFNVSLLALATDLGGPGRAGLAPTVGGVGMIVASLALGRFGLPARRIRALSVALAVIGLGIFVAAVRPHFALLIVGVAIALTALPVANAAMSTVFHERVPGDLQGRVFGIRAAVARFLEPIGSVLCGIAIARLAAPAVADAGALGDAVRVIVGDGPGRDAAVVTAAVGLVVMGIALGLRRARTLRLLDAPLPTEQSSARSEVADAGDAPPVSPAAYPASVA